MWVIQIEQARSTPSKLSRRYCRAALLRDMRCQPDGFHDVTDFIESLPTKEVKRFAIEKLIADTPVEPPAESVGQDDSEWATDLSSFTSLDEAKFPPPLEDAAYYGLAGKIVQRILPETEAHPAALLTDFLTGFGNLIGRTAYAMADGAHHYSIFSLSPLAQPAQHEKAPHGNALLLCWR